MTKFVDRIVSESGGKNLSAEIYIKDNSYTVVKAINGVDVGTSSTKASLDEAKDEALNWIGSVNILLG